MKTIRSLLEGLGSFLFFGVGVTLVMGIIIFIIFIIPPAPWSGIVILLLGAWAMMAKSASEKP